RGPAEPDPLERRLFQERLRALPTILPLPGSKNRYRMTNRLSFIALGIAACGPFLAATPALAQSGATSPPPSAAEAAVSSASEPNRAQKQGKVLHALRISGTPPSIDGRLSDETWRLAEVGTDLTQRDPDNGKPMTDATRVQIAFDDRFLYVAVSALDSKPSDIAVGL